MFVIIIITIIQKKKKYLIKMNREKSGGREVGQMKMGGERGNGDAEEDRLANRI